MNNMWNSITFIHYKWKRLYLYHYHDFTEYIVKNNDFVNG